MAIPTRQLARKLQYLIVKHDRQMECVAELLLAAERNGELDTAACDLFTKLHARKNRLVYLYETLRTGVAVEQISKLFRRIDFDSMTADIERAIEGLDDHVN